MRPYGFGVGKGHVELECIPMAPQILALLPLAKLWASRMGLDIEVTEKISALTLVDYFDGRTGHDSNHLALGWHRMRYLVTLRPPSYHSLRAAAVLSS
jgi:hypothetical protein